MTNSMADTSRAFQRLRAAAPQAVTRALNRSIISARAAMVTVVSQDMGLKAETVREKVRVEDAAHAKPFARLYASYKRIPIIDFDAQGAYPSRGKGRGVSAKLSGTRRRYPNAFLATMRSGHRGVFQRKSGARRLPIRELFGPSIARVFLKHKDVGYARGYEQLQKNLKSEFHFALSNTA